MPIPRSEQTLDDVLEIHRDQIERYGGGEGIRDLGLLQSALAQPSATFGGQYLHADLHEMATAYLSHLAQNHPFLEQGSGRRAYYATRILMQNGFNVRNLAGGMLSRSHSASN
jgi:death-on-curing protein